MYQLVPCLTIMWLPYWSTLVSRCICAEQTGRFSLLQHPIKPCGFNSMCFNMAPRTGLEPVTYGLTVRCSTNWAIEEYLVSVERFELSTPALSKRCSNQLSYTDIINYNSVSFLIQLLFTVPHYATEVLNLIYCPSFDIVAGKSRSPSLTIQSLT